MFSCSWCGKLHSDFYENLEHMNTCRNKWITVHMEEKETAIKAVELLENWLLYGGSKELREETGEFLSNVTSAVEIQEGWSI